MRDVLRRFKSSSSIALLAALGALIAGAVAAAFGEFPLTVARTGIARLGRSELSAS